MKRACVKSDLEGYGIILWANKTEMDFLGYTPEEYIGQPILSKFCVDEPVVLEIFKTLGTGNLLDNLIDATKFAEGKTAAHNHLRE